jgi:hypothetical protein
LQSVLAQPSTMPFIPEMTSRQVRPPPGGSSTLSLGWDAKGQSPTNASKVRKAAPPGVSPKEGDRMTFHATTGSSFPDKLKRDSFNECEDHLDPVPEGLSYMRGEVLVPMTPQQSAEGRHRNAGNAGSSLRSVLAARGKLLDNSPGGLNKAGVRIFPVSPAKGSPKSQGTVSFGFETPQGHGATSVGCESPMRKGATPRGFESPASRKAPTFGLQSQQQQVGRVLNRCVSPRARAVFDASPPKEVEPPALVEHKIIKIDDKQWRCVGSAETTVEVDRNDSSVTQQCHSAENDDLPLGVEWSTWSPALSAWYRSR